MTFQTWQRWCSESCPYVMPHTVCVSNTELSTQIPAEFPACKLTKRVRCVTDSALVSWSFTGVPAVMAVRPSAAFPFDDVMVHSESCWFSLVTLGFGDSFLPKSWVSFSSHTHISVQHSSDSDDILYLWFSSVAYGPPKGSRWGNTFWS